MKRSYLFLAVAIAIAGLAIAIAVSLMHDGMSARAQPSALEMAIAHSARKMAAPKSAKNARNPTADSPEVQREARLHFADHCAMCHGSSGDGKGDMGGDYKTMPDFTNSQAMKTRTDGELFYITRNGKGADMPPEDNRAKDDDIWNMVNYIRSFAKK